jgi:hypothetical protein
VKKYKIETFLILAFQEPTNIKKNYYHQELQNVPSKLEVLSSIPSTAKKKNKRNAKASNFYQHVIIQ